LVVTRGDTNLRIDFGEYETGGGHDSPITPPPMPGGGMPGGGMPGGPTRPPANPPPSAPPRVPPLLAKTTNDDSHAPPPPTRGDAGDNAGVLQGMDLGFASFAQPPGLGRG
jgi:hypothetical protein